MSGLILTKKKQGVSLPVEISDISLYSMEELCYYLYHNIYSINKEFFNEVFFEFLKGMEQEPLIQKLNMDILGGKHYICLAMDVIMAVDYYSEEEKEEIKLEFDGVMRRTPAENIKVRADILHENGKWKEALQGYRRLIEDHTLNVSEKNQADAWNNIGVIHAECFQYEEALECFDRALEIREQQEYMDNLICALIMAGKDMNPIQEKQLQDLKKQMIFKHNIQEELFRRYEEVIAREEKNIELGRETLALKERMSSECQNDIAKYYEDVSILIAEWKKEYREQERERQSK